MMALLRIAFMAPTTQGYSFLSVDVIDPIDRSSTARIGLQKVAGGGAWKQTRLRLVKGRSRN
jgi:hypothetical protein